MYTIPVKALKTQWAFFTALNRRKHAQSVPKPFNE